MAQKVEIICDRCSKEISRYYDIKNVSAKIQLWGVGEYRTSSGQRIDLCEDCYIDFITFLERGTDE
jgi:protein-arginine kinase activator protein McsA